MRAGRELNPNKIKGLLLGAASVVAVVGVGAGVAHAVPQPAPLEHAVVATQVAETKAEPTPAVDSARKFGLIAAAGGVLAALIRLVGARRIVKAIGETGEAAVEAVRAAAAAPVAAVRTMADRLSRPVRFVAAAFGLALVALFGAGLYDLEWLLGLVIGAGSVLSVWRASALARSSSGKQAPNA